PSRNLLGQDSADAIIGRSLTDTPGDADDAHAVPGPVVGAEVAEGVEHVGDVDQRDAGRQRLVQAALIDHGGGGAGLDRLGQEAVAIGVLARESEEQVAGLQPATVGAHAANGAAGPVQYETATECSGDVFDAILHHSAPPAPPP